MAVLVGQLLWWTLALLIWIAIAFWPARVAARKGHSFFGYFLFSLLFFPAALSRRLHGQRPGWQRRLLGTPCRHKKKGWLTPRPISW